MKFSLHKFNLPYQVTMAKDDFFQSGLELGEHFQIEDDQITFLTNKENLQKLLSQFSNIKYRSRLNHLCKRIIIPRIISVVTIILIICLFWSSRFLIREITFKQKESFNPKVYEFVNNQVKKIGPFYFMKGNLNDLSEELRENFIEYAWIGLERRGGKIIINIEHQEVGEGPNEDLSKTGNLIACKDGYIVGYLIERGVNLISISQSVKKGQLLVSGNLKYHNPGEEQWTKAKGLIFADTVEYITKTVPKVNQVVEYNGHLTSRFCLSFFGKNLYSKKSPYKSYDITENELFNLGFLKLAQEELKEKQTIVTIYNEETARELAISIIYQDFYRIDRHPKEKIERIEIVKVASNNDNYIFTFLVQKCENIAIFQGN